MKKVLSVLLGLTLFLAACGAAPIDQARAILRAMIAILPERFALSAAAAPYQYTTPVPHRHRGAEGDADPLQPEGAGRQGGQLGADDLWQGLVHDPAPVRPARAVVREDLADRRHPAREVSLTGDARTAIEP